MGRTRGNIGTFIFKMAVPQQWEEQAVTLALLSLQWRTPTMARTSGNIGTFIFIMTVSNNGKNKW